jgi:DNA-3-methyladenine glycosylase
VIGELLPQGFFARDALDVARDLLGKHVVCGDVALRITEAEAYRWLVGEGRADTANHCARGRTPRNAPMWGEAGHAYVYLCYGIHQMLNVVCGQVDEGCGVLIRSAEPVAGLDVIRSRRGGKSGPVLLTGPGKVAAALGLDASFNRHPVFRAGRLELRDGPAVDRIVAGPRIGVDYADPADRDAPWRLAIADSAWVSARKGLQLQIGASSSGSSSGSALRNA